MFINFYEMYNLLKHVTKSFGNYVFFTKTYLFINTKHSKCRATVFGFTDRNVLPLASSKLTAYDVYKGGQNYSYLLYGDSF